MAESETQGGLLDIIGPPVLFGGLVALALVYWQAELVIPNNQIMVVFGAIFAFGIISNLLIRAHFSVARDNPILTPIFVLAYLSPIVAYLFSSAWTPLVENDEPNRFIAILVAALFAYFSIYSILFLGIETFFDSLKININNSPLRFIFPGFGIELDDEAKGHSWLIVPAAVSLIFSLTIVYYLVDLEYPYSLFSYHIADTNQPQDVLNFTLDETCRAIPIGDICEIWSVQWSLLDAQPDNVLFRIVRTLTNVTLGIAITLLIVYLQGWRAQRSK